LSKDSIKRELQQDREQLLAQISGEVARFKDEFNMRTGQKLDDIVPGMEKPPQSMNASDTVSAIIWSHQLSQKVQQNLKISGSLFKDLGGMQRLEAESNDLCRTIQAYEQNLFAEWVEGIKRALSNATEKAKYEMTGQLMEFDYEAGGILKVNYSEKLVTLVKDARVLGEHGFKIPKPVHAITESAKKFYKEGVTLK
jgi:dynein heavy chain 2